MTIRTAARELRAHLHLSQQAMAAELGVSMGALRNYESGAVAAPEARALGAYVMAAARVGRPDLAVFFRDALYARVGLDERFLARIARLAKK